MIAWWLLAGLAFGSPDNFAACTKQIADTPAERAGFACVYDAARRSGDYATAQQILDDHLAAAPDHPYALHTLGNVLMDQGHHDAGPVLDRALVAMDRTTDTRARVYLRLNASIWYDGAWQPARRDALMTEAATIAAEAGDDALFATVQLQRARMIWRTFGDLSEASALLDEVAPTIERGDRYQDKLVLLHVRSNLLWGLGQHDAALQVLDQQIAFGDAAGDGYATSMALVKKLDWLHDIDETPESGALLAEGRALLPRIDAFGNVWAASLARDTLGKIAHQHGDYDLAISLAEEAIARREGGILDSHDVGYSRLIHALIARGEPADIARAETVVDQLRGVLALSTYPSDFIELPFLETRLALRKGDIEAARVSAARAVTAWNDIVDRVIDDAERAVHGEEAGRELLGLADAAAGIRVPAPAPAAIAFAFELSEQARGAGLRAALHSGGVSALGLAEKRALGVARKARDEAREAFGSADPADVDVQPKPPVAPGNHASDPPPDPEMAALLKAFTDAEAALGALVESRRQHEAALRRARLPPIALDALQATLQPEEALVLYQLSGASLGRQGFGLLITRDSVRRFPAPARGPLERRARAFRELVRARDDGWRDAAAGLHRDLLAEPLAELPPSVTRLVVVPDGPVWELPLSALIAAGDAATHQRLAVSLAPSATVWAALRAETAAEHAALVLADPTADNADGRAPPLPMARAEADYIASLLGDHALIWRGADATEAALRSVSLSRFSVVHVAAHAVADQDVPARSAVRLSPAGEDDGRLTLEEISGLALEGQLVLLSACDSASGRVVTGEGPLALTRAFLAAGAGAVLGTLWPIRDADALALQQRVWDGLAEGLPADVALRNAQSQLAAAGAPPEAWAGAVLVGDASRAPLPHGAPRQGPGLAALASVALLGLAAALALGGLLRRRA